MERWRLVAEKQPARGRLQKLYTRGETMWCVQIFNCVCVCVCPVIHTYTTTTPLAGNRLQLKCDGTR